MPIFHLSQYLSYSKWSLYISIVSHRHLPGSTWDVWYAYQIHLVTRGEQENRMHKNQSIFSSTAGAMPSLDFNWPNLTSASRSCHIEYAPYLSGQTLSSVFTKIDTFLWLPLKTTHWQSLLVPSWLSRNQLLLIFDNICKWECGRTLNQINFLFLKNK